MLNRLRKIGLTLDTMHLSDGKGRAELAAYLKSQGYRNEDIERCARDLVAAGFMSGTTAKALGVYLSIDDHIAGRHAAKREDERQMRNLMKTGSREGGGCAGLLLLGAVGWMLF